MSLLIYKTEGLSEVRLKRRPAIQIAFWVPRPLLMMSPKMVCQNSPEVFSMTANLRDFTKCVLRVLEMPLRVACDQNLYSFEEFLGHYGEDSGRSRWEKANSLLNPLLLIAEDGRIFDFRMRDLSLASLCVSPALISIIEWNSRYASITP